MDNSFGQNLFYYEKDKFLNYTKLGSGPTNLVFLHGFGASLNTWNDIVIGLDTTKYSMYLFDLKGFGLSSKPKDDKYSILDQSDIIESFIKTNELSDIILIGHSYGGGVALTLNLSFVKKKANIIKKLILLDCAAFSDEIPFFIRYLQMPILNNISLFMSYSFQVKFTLNRLFFDKDKITQKIINRYIFSFEQKGTKYSFIKAAKQIVPQNYSSIIKDYNLINNKVLIIWGENDPVISKSIGYKTRDILKNSEISIIAECGHIPNEEKPKETLSLIKKFIE